MPKFRAKPLLIRAERFSFEALLDWEHGEEREAERIRLGLGIDDPRRIFPGGLVGWLDFSNSGLSESGTLRPGMWLVHWPNGQLTAMENDQFNLLFAPASAPDEEGSDVR
jgi:hypothetical protein